MTGLANSLVRLGGNVTGSSICTPDLNGYLSGFNRVAGDFMLRALRPELERLGWTEGRNFVFLEPRMAEGANGRPPPSQRSSLRNVPI